MQFEILVMTKLDENGIDYKNYKNNNMLHENSRKAFLLVASYFLRLDNLQKDILSCFIF
jgi:hypothetical protein